MTDPVVRFRNLGEFASALRKVNRELPRELRLRMLTIAKGIASTARDRMHFKHPSGAAERSVVGRATTRGARIEGGGDKVPYYPWLDFGGSVGRGHKPGVGWSGAIKRLAPKGGLYIYPAIASRRDDTERQMADVIKDVGHDAGFKVEVS